MSKDSIIEQLANFDFSGPVEVKVIFEDEEDSSPDIVVKEEKTDEEENNSNETTNPISSDIVVKEEKTTGKENNSNKMTNPINSSHDENITKIEKDLNNTSKLNEESEENSSPEGNGSRTINTKYNNPGAQTNQNKKILIENVISSIINTKPDPKDTVEIKTTECYGNKRKIDEDMSCETNKYSRRLENDIIPKYAFHIEQNPSQQRNTSVIVTQNYAPCVNQEVEDAENSSNTEMTCITNLLQSVAKHLVIILEAHSRYAFYKENKPNSSEAEKSWGAFLRAKYYYFNLSFCTVDSIILPQEKNLFFTGKFMNDVIKFAASKKRVLCLETQVAPLFLELLEWTKQKKLQFNNTPNLPIETVSNTGQTKNSPLLQQQLRSPPKYIIDINKNLPTIASDNRNNFVNTVQQKKTSSLEHASSETASVLQEIDRLVNSHYQKAPAIQNPSVNEASALHEHVKIYHQPPNLPTNYRNLSNENKNVEINLNIYANSHVEHNASLLTTPKRNPCAFNNNVASFPKTNQMQTKNYESIQNTNLNPHEAVSNVLQNGTEDSKSVLFATGPPGNQISITVDQAILQSCGNNRNTASTTVSNHHQTKIPVQRTQSGNQISTAPPSYDQARSYQMYTQQAQQMAHQNLVTNSYVQSNIPHGYQNSTSMTVDHLRQNCNQGNHIYMQQDQQMPRQNVASQGNNIYIQQDQQMPRQNVANQGNNIYIQQDQQMPRQNLANQGNNIYIQQDQQMPPQNVANQGNNIYIQQDQQMPRQNVANQGNNIYIQQDQQMPRQNVTNQGNNIYIQQGQKTPQQNAANNSFRQITSLLQGYQSTAANTPFLQQDTTVYNRSMGVNQRALVQPVAQHELQNPEMTRSCSTDSGFMSPLNLYSPSESNKDGTEENFSSPMITHVTSLNPDAKYISEGPCYVCGNTTRKMCNGCYKKYYCSLSCQRSDWSVHKSECGHQ